MDTDELPPAGHSEKLVSLFAQHESCGAEVLKRKEQLVSLDQRRQQLRQGVRCLLKTQPAAEKTAKVDKNWLCLGPTVFLKLPTDKSKELLEDDLKSTERTIEKTRDELKEKMDELSEFEGKADLKKLGFELVPLNSDEMKAMGTLTKR